MTNTSTDPAESFGRAIQLRRTQLGMSRRDFAIEAGLSYPYVCEIEKGQKEPSAKARRQLLNALKLDPSEFASFWTVLAETAEESPAPLPLSDQSRPLTSQRLRHAAPEESWAFANLATPRRWNESANSGPESGPDQLITQLVARVLREELARWAENELPGIVRAEVEAALGQRELRE